MQRKLILATLLTCQFLVETLVAQNIINIDTANVKILRIDPNKARGGKFSEIFEKITYVPLETTKKSQFGGINQLEVTDEYFIVLDYKTNSILIFERNGTFHAKIQGKKGGFDKMIWRFVIDPFSKNIVYYTDNFETQVFCDFHGNFIKEYKKKDSPNYSDFWKGRFLSEGLAVNFSNYSSKTSDKQFKFLLQFFKKNEGLSHVSFPYTEEEGKIDVLQGSFSPLTSSGRQNGLYFSKPYSYDIFEIEPLSVKMRYKLMFPLGNVLPFDFTTSRIYNGKREAYIKGHPDLIYGISNFYKNGENLIFRTHSLNTNRFDNLIYNTSSGKLIAYKLLSPDILSSFLPIYDTETSTFSNVGIGSSDGDYIYTSMSSIAMISAKNKGLSDGVKLDEGLARFFAKASAISNPVVVQLKIKKNL